MTNIEFNQLKRKTEELQSVYMEAQLLKNKIQQLSTTIEKIQNNEITIFNVNNIDVNIDFRTKLTLISILKAELEQQQKTFNEYAIEKG